MVGSLWNWRGCWAGLPRPQRQARAGAMLVNCDLYRPVQLVGRPPQRGPPGAWGVGGWQRTVAHFSTKAALYCVENSMVNQDKLSWFTMENVTLGKPGLSTERCPRRWLRSWYVLVSRPRTLWLVSVHCPLGEKWEDTSILLRNSYHLLGFLRNNNQVGNDSFLAWYFSNTLLLILGRKCKAVNY